MTENIITTLRDNKKARWTALLIVSFTMMTGYYINYVISPLKPLLEDYFNWSSTDFGFWNSAYGWFNVFFLMLIFGGIILDKIGIRFTGLSATLTMVVGTLAHGWGYIWDKQSNSDRRLRFRNFWRWD